MSISATIRPVAFLFTYVGDDGEEFTTHEPIDRVPVKVQHLYDAGQMAEAQEIIKIRAAAVVQQTLNGNIYADRIRKIETVK